MIHHCKPLLLTFALLAVLSSRLDAQATRIWDGEGNDGDFANAANWNGNSTVPSSGDILQVGQDLGGLGLLGFNSPAGTFNAPSFTFLSTASTYMVTAFTANDILRLTGSGVTMLNSSNSRQVFSLITTITATSQTWDGGANGIKFAQVDLGTGNTLTITGTGTSASTRNEAIGGFAGSSAGITKTGSGTLFFNTTAPNSYDGDTTITGGRLLLGASHQIPNASRLVMNGGIFDTGGFSDTIGKLALTNFSTIDFGTGTSGLQFAASNLETWAHSP